MKLVEKLASYYNWSNPGNWQAYTSHSDWVRIWRYFLERRDGLPVFRRAAVLRGMRQLFE